MLLAPKLGKRGLQRCMEFTMLTTDNWFAISQGRRSFE